MPNFPMEDPDVDEATREDRGRSVTELLQLIDERGAVVPRIPAAICNLSDMPSWSTLPRERTRSSASIIARTLHCDGTALATVWPGGAAGQVALALSKAHVTGPHRTLMQDPVFAIDQLVEIAIRALSPAVNDTFTALTCIDWLSAGLSQVSSRTLSEGVYRDRFHRVRLIETDPSYARMVNRAFDKIRQASPRNACRPHPHVGRPDLHRIGDHLFCTAGRPDAPGRDDPPERRGVRARSERP